MTEIREALSLAISWANERLRSGSEPPWSYYRLMQLEEAASELLAGMNAAIQPSLESSWASEPHSTNASQQAMDDAPLHMNGRTRNHRLYETLVGMGLFVEPAPRSDSPDAIDYLIVSVDLPTRKRVSENPASGIVPLAKRALVREKFGTAENGGGEVINFPTVVSPAVACPRP